MKNFSRIICLVLVVLIALLALSACGDDTNEETSSVIAQDGEEVNTDEEEEEIEIVETEEAGFSFKDQAIAFVVAEDGVEKCETVNGTTLKAFIDNIELQEGYTAKVFAADGTEVTDENATIENGMTVKIFKGTEETASYEIVVKSEEEIQETVEIAESQAAAAEEDADDGNQTSGSSKTKTKKTKTKKNTSSNSTSSKTGTNNGTTNNGTTNNGTTNNGTTNNGTTNNGTTNNGTTNNGTTNNGTTNNGTTNNGTTNNGTTNNGTTNNGKTNTSSKSGTTINPATNSNKPVSTLSGYNFKLGTIYKGAFTGSDAASKALQDQVAKIKSKYNCTVEYIDYSGDYQEMITKEVTADSARADVIQIDLGVCRKLAREGYLADWSKSNTLDLKGKYNNASTQSQTVNGKCFGIAYAAMAGDHVMGVLFNKSLVKQYGGGLDIYSLYKDNKWTSENFKTLSENVYANSNKKVFGFASNTNIIGMAMTSFAGGTALMKGGKVEATLCTQNSIESMKWCKELYNGKSWYYNANIDNALAKFSNKESAMFVSYLNYYVQIASSGNFDMGFVPMPMDSRQGKYISGTYNGSFYVVPKTTKNKKSLDAYGDFMNLLAAVSTKQINNTVATMKRNSLDSTATQVYKNILNKYLVPEYSTGVFSGDFAARVDAAVLQPSKDPSSVMNGLKSEAQNLCDDFYNFSTKFKAD